MTYKFDENILKGKQNFTIATSDTLDHTRYLFPLFINCFGNINYGGNDHLNNDILRYASSILNSFIDDLLENNKPKNLFNNTNTSIIYPFKRFTTYSTLNFNDINPYFNIKHSLLDPSLSFNFATLMLCNSIIESKFQVSKSLSELKNSSQNLVELIINLLHFFKVSTTNLSQQKRAYTPFVDTGNYDNSYYYKISSIILDFLTLYIGLDKIETARRKTITTTKKDIYETYFNYMLMDFDIVKLPKIIYDSKSNDWSWKQTSFISSSKEKEYEQELKLIKKHIPYDKRDKYFL